MPSPLEKILHQHLHQLREAGLLRVSRTYIHRAYFDHLVYLGYATISEPTFGLVEYCYQPNMFEDKLSVNVAEE